MTRTPNYLRAIEAIVKQLAVLTYLEARNSGPEHDEAMEVSLGTARDTLFALRGPKGDPETDTLVDSFLNEIRSDLRARGEAHDKARSF